MMFPIYVKYPKTEPPSNDVHYIIAKNGIFLHKKNSWIDATIPVKQIGILEDQPAYATNLLPPINGIVLGKIIRFFKAIYDRYRTEAAVLLYYDDENGWDLSVPEQTVTGSNVNYNPKDRIAGRACVGTMHSHASMSAFHSGTDQHDEADWDGIHITIGSMNEYPNFTMDPELVVNGARFWLGPEHFDGTDSCEPPSYRRWFMKQSEKWYTLVPYTELEHWEVPQEWFLKVKTLWATPAHTPYPPSFLPQATSVPPVPEPDVQVVSESKDPVELIPLGIEEVEDSAS